MNTTTQRLEALVANIDKESRRLGLITDPDKTGFDQGSKSNGVAFRLFLLKGGSTAHWNHPAYRNNSGFLGFTKSDADHTLSTIFEVLSNIPTPIERTLSVNRP